jgi:hypothetical protein
MADRPKRSPRQGAVESFCIDIIWIRKAIV